MGGAFGHIMHPFEDLELTIGELRSMLEEVSSGRIDLYEKFDGVNLMFRVHDGELRCARSISEVRAGGIEVDDLAQRFSVPSVGARMVSAATALSSLAGLDRLKDGWHSLDVISRDGANVVRYDEDAIVLHPVRVSGGNVEWPVNDLNAWHRAKVVGHDDRAWRTIAPRKITTSNSGMRTFEKHRSLFEYAETATLDEIYRLRIADAFMNQIMHDASMALRIAKRVLRSPGHESLVELKRCWSSPRTKNVISEFVNDDVRIIRHARSGVESLVRDFTVELLEDLGSSCILDHDDELKRTRADYFMQLNELTARGLTKKYQHDIDALGELDELTMTMEGVVFRWTNGKLYKLVGLYKHLNQVMGVGRYARQR